jgi:hypothetical protein
MYMLSVKGMEMIATSPDKVDGPPQINDIKMAMLLAKLWDALRDIDRNGRSAITVEKLLSMTEWAAMMLHAPPHMLAHC